MVASQGMMLLMYAAANRPSPRFNTFNMWLTRDFNGKPGWSALLPNPSYASDGTVAIMFAILLFIVRPQGSPIMDWDSIAKCMLALAPIFFVLCPPANFYTAIGFHGTFAFCWAAALPSAWASKTVGSAFGLQNACRASLTCLRLQL